MEKKICEQRPGGNEGTGNVNSWGKSIPETGNSEKVRSKAHADRVGEQQGPRGQNRGRKGER